MTNYERQFRDAAEGALQAAVESEERGNVRLAAYQMREAMKFEKRADLIATEGGHAMEP